VRNNLMCLVNRGGQPGHGAAVSAAESGRRFGIVDDKLPRLGGPDLGGAVIRMPSPPSR